MDGSFDGAHFTVEMFRRIEIFAGSHLSFACHAHDP
jgi:hypothetical protein